MSEPGPSLGTTADEVIFLPPGAGRHYDAGPMHAVFKADGEETADRYVTEGTMSFLAGDGWVDAPAGSFLRIPAGVIHDFENRGAEGAGVLNVFLPGGFEALMPQIVDYFAERVEGALSPTAR
jgi:Cupin domain